MDLEVLLARTMERKTLSGSGTSKDATAIDGWTNRIRMTKRGKSQDGTRKVYRKIHELGKPPRKDSTRSEWEKATSTKVLSILGGEKELGQKIQTPIDFNALIRKGMPQTSLSHVKSVLHLSDGTLARIIGVSVRTVTRRGGGKSKAERRLSPVESDRLYRFARIVALAEDVFEDRDDAIEWLNSKQYGLGGAVPINMLQTDAGSREVEGLLHRIEHGIIS
jgi:putative toxin-antitoxin system antitoxin component (TIGR02293 family)